MNCLTTVLFGFISFRCPLALFVPGIPGKYLFAVWHVMQCGNNRHWTPFCLYRSRSNAHSFAHKTKTTLLWTMMTFSYNVVSSVVHHRTVRPGPCTTDMPEATGRNACPQTILEFVRRTKWYMSSLDITSWQATQKNVCRLRCLFANSTSLSHALYDSIFTVGSTILSASRNPLKSLSKC